MFEEELKEIKKLMGFHKDLQTDPQLQKLNGIFDEIYTHLEIAKERMDNPDSFSQREIDRSRLMIEWASKKLTWIYELLANHEELESLFSTELNYLTQGES